jgi:hypothetical protein
VVKKMLDAIAFKKMFSGSQPAEQASECSLGWSEAKPQVGVRYCASPRSGRQKIEIGKWDREICRPLRGLE